MKLTNAKLVCALLICASLAFASDAEPRKSPRPGDTKAKVGVKKAVRKPLTQVGTASWYGKAFHGRLTASGETYDMFQFTAASRALPLGTLAKVTNLRNGRWVIVKVNDRGPYVGNRILDVSYGAAQMLNFRARGVERVKIEVIEPETMAMADPVTSLD
jgi:rare lipoprotein A (peptidoglycan hydrolase)